MKVVACHSCAFDRLVADFVTFSGNLPTKCVKIETKRGKKPVNVIQNAKVRSAVEVIHRYLAKRCETCRRTPQDDIRIKKSPHVKGDMARTDCDTTETIEAAAGPRSAERSCATPLPPDVEDTLRRAMANFWALSPVQLLCVQHLMQGKKLSEFGATLRGVHEQIRKYRGSERSQAGMMRNAIAERIPFIAPILNARPQTITSGISVRIEKNDGKECDIEIDGGNFKNHIKVRVSDGAYINDSHELVKLVDLSAISDNNTTLGELFEAAGIGVPFDTLERRTRR